MQIFVNTSLNEANRNALKKQWPAGHALFFKNEWSEKEQIAAFQNSQVVLGNPPAAWLAEAPPLLQCCFSGRCASLAAARRGLPVGSTARVTRALRAAAATTSVTRSGNRTLWTTIVSSAATPIRPALA